jgi:hypothetical protein
MTYDLVGPGGTASAGVGEPSEYRRTHFRVYDENGFASAFLTGPPENATLTSVLACLLEKFHGTAGSGYDSKDLVVLLGPRIIAVVRGGRDGCPEVTTFEP